MAKPITWIGFQDKAGKKWALNQEGLYLLTRKWIRETEIQSRTKVVSIDNGALMPTTFQAETKWDGFRDAVDNAVPLYYTELERMLANGEADMALEKILQSRQQMRNSVTAVDKMRKQVLSDSAKNIDDNVDNWNTALEVAKGVRDLSAFTLVACASLMTGGAALTVMGTTFTAGAGTLTAEAVGILAAGSTLKGVSRFQDTGKVGSAVVEGAGTFVLGLIPVAGNVSKVSRADTVILTVMGASLDGVFEASKTTMDGGSGKTALTQAGARIGIDLLTAGLGTRLEKLSFGSQVRINSGLGWVGDQGVNFAGGQAPGIVTAGGKTLRQIGGILMPSADIKIDYGAVGAEDVTDTTYVNNMVLRRL